MIEIFSEKSKNHQYNKSLFHKVVDYKHDRNLSRKQKNINMIETFFQKNIKCLRGDI